MTKVGRSRVFLVGTQTLTSPTSATDALLFKGAVAIQITGPATAVTVVVERSTSDPASGANWAPADADAVTGNPSTGVPVQAYLEPAAAWWRVRLTAMTGASVTISLSGQSD